MAIFPELALQMIVLLSFQASSILQSVPWIAQQVSSHFKVRVDLEDLCPSTCHRTSTKTLQCHQAASRTK
jgi:hypothetical protein